MTMGGLSRMFAPFGVRRDAGRDHADDPTTEGSNDFVEAMWDTLIALATVAAICVSLISLAAHLNASRTARGPDGGVADTPAGVAAMATPAAPRAD